MLVTKEEIARIAHNVNRAYCESLGDTSQPVWEDAPDWQKKSALAGVEMHLANPLATPEQSHESWLAVKVADGWVYGDTKDPAKKQHPCVRPYAELPPEQKAKDYLFRCIVHQLAALPAPQQPVAQLVPAPGVTPVNASIPVQYIGKRETHKENLYGTNLVFSQGETKIIPAAAAVKMLKNHPDVYAPGKLKGATPAPEAPKPNTRETEQEESLQEVRDTVANMTKDALLTFATTHSIQVPKNGNKPDILAAINVHIDRFGVATA